MRYFLDTEFIDTEASTNLISIALVCEDGREFYAWCNEGWEYDECDDWLKQNVLNHMPGRDHIEMWMSQEEIAREIIKFMPPESNPQIWAYYGDYDWVLFSKLFGRMLDLPKGYPHLCLDLKQEMLRLGVTREQLPTQIGAEHDALNDAQWLRTAFDCLQGEEGMWVWQHR